jgi:hypothetical protein
MLVEHVPAYRRRTPEDTLLYQVIQEEFATFQAQASQEGRCLPLFVRDEFHKYLECGQLACGFARVARPVRPTRWADKDFNRAHE